MLSHALVSSQQPTEMATRHLGNRAGKSTTLTGAEHRRANCTFCGKKSHTHRGAAQDHAFHPVGVPPPNVPCGGCGKFAPGYHKCFYTKTWHAFCQGIQCGERKSPSPLHTETNPSPVDISETESDSDSISDSRAPPPAATPAPNPNETVSAQTNQTVAPAAAAATSDTTAPEPVVVKAAANSNIKDSVESIDWAKLGKWSKDHQEGKFPRTYMSAAN